MAGQTTCQTLFNNHLKPYRNGKNNNARKTDTPKTRTTQEVAARNIAKGIFDARMDMDEVHVASDGTAFYTLSDAKNYARTLKNDKVVTVRRTDSDLPSDDTASETASATQAANTEAAASIGVEDGDGATDNDKEE